MSKIFADDEPKTENVEMVVEAPKPKKPRKKRAPLTPEQKQALVERLAKARAAKKNAKLKPTENDVGTIEQGTDPVKKTRKPRAKKAEPNIDYQKNQSEIVQLRHQLELQKLKHELQLERNTKSKPKVEPTNTVIDKPNAVVNKDPVVVAEVAPIVDYSPPVEKKKIRKNIANSGNIWDMIRNSN